VSQLSDVPIDIKVKLAALWAATMLCYIYCDYFELYMPGKLDAMMKGRLGPFDVTQGVLIGTSIMMAVPSLMVFLSVALRARSNRMLNIVVGIFFTLLMALLTVAADWYFYKLFAAIETTLTALVVWYAWTWPKAESVVQP
jgi:hypothetical protein